MEISNPLKMLMLISLSRKKQIGRIWRKIGKKKYFRMQSLMELRGSFFDKLNFPKKEVVIIIEI